VSPFRLRLAARTLRAGGVVAHPTEAVFGLACNPYSARAVLHLLQLKGRPGHKGLILITDRFERLLDFVPPPDAAMWARIAPTWPGAVTWLMPARPACPVWLTGGRDQLAVRVTAHPLAAALCAATGLPLVSTSANRSGRPPARRALQVRRSFGRRLHAILPGATGGRARPSEIRDALTGAIIRPG
jgi:L-threonylcarbamoyladenylate synthase